MADLMLANSTYQTGTNDSASTIVNNVTATDASQPNGLGSACIQIETILGTGTTLKGTAADLVGRLSILLQASGQIKDKDALGNYAKWDGWLGYGTNTLKRLPSMRFPGEITWSSLTAIPTGWLDCNAQQVSCTVYEDLLDAALADFDVVAVPIGYSRGTANHTLAQATDINTATDTLTKTAHGLSNGTVVHLKSSVTIPTGLTTLTKYYLVGVTANTYQLSLTSGGAAVDITAVGSGTLSVYTTFQLPDYRGRSPMAVGTGSGLTNRLLNTAYGEEAHLLTGPESGIQAHSHTYNDPYATPPGPGAFQTNQYANSYGPTSTGTTGPTNAQSSHNTIHPVVGMRCLVRY